MGLKRKFIKLVIAVMILIIGAGVVIGASTNTEDSSSTVTTDTPSIDKTEISGILYNVTDVKLGTGNIFGKPDGKHLIIYMTIENTGTETETITSGQFELVDEKNRHFKVADNYFSEYPELILYEELQPDLPVKRQVAFDVPFDQDLMYELHILENELFAKYSKFITIKLGMGKDFT